MASPQTAGAWRCCSRPPRPRASDTDPAALRPRCTHGGLRPASRRSCRAAARSTSRRPGTLLKRGRAPDAFTVSAPVCTEVWKILGVTTGTGVYNRCAAGDGGQAPVQQDLPGHDHPHERQGVRHLRRVAASATTGRSRSARRASRCRSKPGHRQGHRQAGGRRPQRAAADRRQQDARRLTPRRCRRRRGTEHSAPDVHLHHDRHVDRNEATRYYVTVPAGPRRCRSGSAASRRQRRPGSSPSTRSACRSTRPPAPPATATAAPTRRATREAGVREPAAGRLGDPGRVAPDVAGREHAVHARRLAARRRPSRRRPRLRRSRGHAEGRDVDRAQRLRHGHRRRQGRQARLRQVRRPTIADGAVQAYTVEVPAGADRLDVKIGRTSDTGADLDLYVRGPSGAEQSRPTATPRRRCPSQRRQPAPTP